MYNFRKFTQTSARTTNKITITNSNSIGFPTQFYKNQKITDFKYAVIYFDQEQKVLGIQFTNDEDEKHRFTLIKSKDGYGASIVATSFFKTNNLDPKIYRGKYDWTKEHVDNVGELYIIKLKEREKITAEN